MEKLEIGTPIHHYRGLLLIGDATEIINIIKGNLDKDPPFFDYETDTYLNEIKEIKKFGSSKFYCMPYNGGGFHELFYTRNNLGITGFYIDCASNNFRMQGWVPKKFYSKKHKDQLFHNLKKSIDTSKPIAEFECPSKKILLCQASGKIVFYGEDGQVSIDYKNKSTNDIILELEEYCYSPKVKFQNWMSNIEDATLDFFIDDIFKNKFQIYEVIFQNKKIESFADYYGTYYANDKNLYKKIYLSKKEKEVMKKWQEPAYSIFDEKTAKKMMEKEKEREDQGTAPIEKYKSYVDDNGFFMGYYFKAI